MPLTYDEAVRVWAAKKLDLPPEMIKNVEFSVYDESVCPTCGPMLSIEADVYFVDGSRPQTIRPQTIGRSTWEMGELIREIVEAGNG